MRNCIFLKWIIDLLFYSPPVINKRTRMPKLCVICIVQGVRSEADFLSHFIYKHKDFHDITYMSWKSHLTLFFFYFHGHFDQSLLLHFHILTSDCLHDAEWDTPRTMTTDKNPSLIYNNFTHLSVLQNKSVISLLFFFKLASIQEGDIINMLKIFIFWTMGYY